MGRAFSAAGFRPRRRGRIGFVGPYIAKESLDRILACGWPPCEPLVVGPGAGVLRICGAGPFIYARRARSSIFGQAMFNARPVGRRCVPEPLTSTETRS